MTKKLMLSVAAAALLSLAMSGEPAMAAAPGGPGGVTGDMLASFANGNIPFGGGSALFGADGVISAQCPGVAGGVQPGATGADTVIGVYSLPAGSLDKAGRLVDIAAWVSLGATGNNKTIKLFFNATTAVVGQTITGGTLLASTGVTAQNGGTVKLEGSVMKRGALGSNTQTCLPGGVQLSASHIGLSAAAADTTAVENAPILIAVTANCATVATDASLNALQVFGRN